MVTLSGPSSKVSATHWTALQSGSREGFCWRAGQGGADCWIRRAGERRRGGRSREQNPADRGGAGCHDGADQCSDQQSARVSAVAMFRAHCQHHRDSKWALIGEPLKSCTILIKCSLTEPKNTNGSYHTLKLIEYLEAA